MRATVVDASALAAVLFDEPEAEPIVASVSGMLIAPTLLRYEMASVCTVKQLRHPDRAVETRQRAAEVRTTAAAQACGIFRPGELRAALLPGTKAGSWHPGSVAFLAGFGAAISGTQASARSRSPGGGCRSGWAATMSPSSSRWWW